MQHYHAAAKERSFHSWLSTAAVTPPRHVEDKFPAARDDVCVAGSTASSSATPAVRCECRTRLTRVKPLSQMSGPICHGAETRPSPHTPIGVPRFDYGPDHVDGIILKPCSLLVGGVGVGDQGRSRVESVCPREKACVPIYLREQGIGIRRRYGYSSNSDYAVRH